MMIFLYILSGFVVLFLFLVLCVVILRKMENNRTEQDVLKFIGKHPERASFFMMENGKILVDVESEVKRPLASVVKIMVLAEFAERIAAGQVDPNEQVALSSLDRYYLDRTDGGAHLTWVKSIEEQGLLQNAACSIIEVARGMMRYSSNANTEFLIERLGLEAINHRIQQCRMKQHDPLFPMTSAMLMPTYLMDTMGWSVKEATTYIQNLSYLDYAAKAMEIFELLQADKEGKWIGQLHRKEAFGLKLQSIWSEKQPGSSAQEYARLLYDIQQGRRLSEKAQSIFHELMKLELKNGSPIVKLGQKGGSTLSIINQTMYYEDGGGNQVQFALFVHDPKGLDQSWIEKKLPLFIHRLLTDEAFKHQIVQTLS